MAKTKNEWQVQEAKAHFSEVIRRAHRDGPQRITTHGRHAVLVVAEEQYAAAPEYDNLADLLLDSPLRGRRLKLDRKPDFGRDVKLWPAT